METLKYLFRGSTSKDMSVSLQIDSKSAPASKGKDDTPEDVTAIFKTVSSGGLEEVQKAVNEYRTSHVESSISSRKLSSFSGGQELLHQTDKDGRNLLHHACMYNNDDVATWLLGIEDSSYSRSSTWYTNPDSFGATAAMYAASSGLQNFLLKWKHDFSAVDKNGRNILVYFAGEGQEVPDLQEARNKFYKLSKHFQDKVKVFSNLLSNPGLNFNMETGLGFIRWVLDNRRLDLVSSYMLKARIITYQLHQQFVCGGFIHALLHQAFNVDREKIYSSSSSKSKSSLSPSHSTISKLGTSDRLQSFIKTVNDCKLDVNHTDTNGMTVLHYLCYYEFHCEPYGLREALISELLKMGADPNIKDIKCYTPLMCAVEKGLARPHSKEQRETVIYSLLNKVTTKNETEFAAAQQLHNQLIKVKGCLKDMEDTSSKENNLFKEDFIKLKRQVTTLEESVDSLFKLQNLQLANDKHSPNN